MYSFASSKLFTMTSTLLPYAVTFVSYFGGNVYKPSVLQARKNYNRTRLYNTLFRFILFNFMNGFFS